jgi:hypothetical protein
MRSARPAQSRTDPAAPEEPQQRHQKNKTDQATDQPVRPFPPINRLERIKVHTLIERMVLRNRLVFFELGLPLCVAQRRQRAHHRLPFCDRKAGLREPRGTADQHHGEHKRRDRIKPKPDRAQMNVARSPCEHDLCHRKVVESRADHIVLAPTPATSVAFRSPHHSSRESEMRTSEPKPPWIDKVLVSLWIPKLANEGAAQSCELRNRDTRDKSSMPIRLRKFIGAIALILLVVVWALLAMAVAQAPFIFDNMVASIAYYVIAGIGWVLPAMPIVSWMSRPNRDRV